MASTFKLTHYAYCGMSVPMGEGERAEMRGKVAEAIRRRRRQGFPVTKLGHDEWEIMEPEDAAMVSDACGVLKLAEIKPKTVECWNCGFDVEVGTSCNCMDTEDTED